GGAETLRYLPIFPILFAITSVAYDARAENSETISCPAKLHPTDIVPVVPTKDVAKNIYVAVVKAHDPNAYSNIRGGKSKVVALDDGDIWVVEVDQNPPIAKGKDSEAERRAAYGFVTIDNDPEHLVLNINKCTGVV